MIRKILILLVAYYLIIIVVQSCDSGYCKDVDYYDFSKVLINIKKSTTISKSDSLKFEINQLDTRYMAQNCIKLNLIKTASALNCDYGLNGMKIPLTKIEVTSYSDFNESLLANTLLNDLIIVKVIKDNEYSQLEYEYKPFDSVEFNKLLPREDFLNPDFYIVKHPTIDISHILKVKITKSNGDTIISKSEQIFWE